MTRNILSNLSRTATVVAVLMTLGMLSPAVAMGESQPDPELAPNDFAPPSIVDQALFKVAEQAMAQQSGTTANAETDSDPGFVTLSEQLIRRFAVTLTAREALAAMDQGLLTSREYVDVLIERIQEFPAINAFIATDFEAARAAADEADAMRAEGESLGPLHGLPVVIKDSIFTEDFPTTAGTPGLADFQPDQNAPAVQALIDAGAIILGKTNLQELQAGFTNNNAFTGPTRNPYDFDRIPGGSSGGNSAALAARLAPLALGADSGGSTRVPAALTGTYGFRPTTGRYSGEGVVPISSIFDTLGPMARDVRDLALADAVLTGEDAPLEPMAVQGLRIGVPSALFREGLAFPSEWHFYRSLRRLERAGAKLVEADIPGVGADSLQAYQAIVFFEAPVQLAGFLAEIDIGVTLEDLVGMIASPSVAGLFAQAVEDPVPEEVFNDVVDNALPMLRQLYLDYLESNDLDAVIYPTVPAPALEIGQEPVVEINGEQVSVFELYLRNMHYAPLMGAPAVTLPIGQTRGPLPAGGMDVMGAPGADREILAVAHAIAQILPRALNPRDIRPRPFAI